MKKVESVKEKRLPRSLAEMDFQILCQKDGKEKALQIMRLSAALQKESTLIKSPRRPVR